MKVNPRKLLSDCCQYLEIDSSFYSLLPDDVISSQILASKDKVLRLNERVYSKCSEFYSDSIRDLEQVLGREITEWK